MTRSFTIVWLDAMDFDKHPLFYLPICDELYKQNCIETHTHKKEKRKKNTYDIVNY
jgi:hypothetical protein